MAAPTQVDAEALAKVLRRLRHGVAARPSMLTNDHLRAMFPADTEQDKAALAPLLSCINKILRAELDDETADWLAGATLVALYKPDGAGGLKTRVSAALRWTSARSHHLRRCTAWQPCAAWPPTRAPSPRR